MKFQSILILITLLGFASCSQPGKVEHIDVQTAVKLIDTEKDLQVVDLRTPGEVNATGMLPHAQPINFVAPDFMAKVAGLDKNKPVLLYCATGSRSAQASAMLEKEGFKTIYDLAPGISGWLRANQKTVTHN
ncbi:MAG: rhodanese-like domain-containing protein [Saprospiraceae bacterium]